MTRLGLSTLLVATVNTLPGELSEIQTGDYLEALENVPDHAVPALKRALFQRFTRWPKQAQIFKVWQEIRPPWDGDRPIEHTTQEPPDTRNPEERRIDRTRGSIFLMALNHQLGKAMVRREGIDRGALVRDTENGLQNAGLPDMMPETKNRIRRDTR